MSYLLFLFIVFIVVGSILYNSLYVDENRWRLVEYDSQYIFHQFSSHISRTNTIERVLLTGRGNDIHMAIRAIDPLTSCIPPAITYES